MKTVAVLPARPAEPEPAKPKTEATAGSFCTMPCNWASFWDIAGKEIA